VVPGVKSMHGPAMEDVAAVMALEPNNGVDHCLRGIIEYTGGSGPRRRRTAAKPWSSARTDDFAVGCFHWMSRSRMGERTQANLDLRFLLSEKKAQTPLSNGRTRPPPSSSAAFLSAAGRGRGAGQ